jgi:photosystem II stability/assembly factor-like uncharacterized protein
MNIEVVFDRLINLKANQLQLLAMFCNQLSDDLRKDKPSYRLAILNGITDFSYNTDTDPPIHVASYSGTALVKLDNGSIWKCRGHFACRKSVEQTTVIEQGYIDFALLEDPNNLCNQGSKGEKQENQGGG